MLTVLVPAGTVALTLSAGPAETDTADAETAAAAPSSSRAGVTRSAAGRPHAGRRDHAVLSAPGGRRRVAAEVSWHGWPWLPAWQLLTPSA